jgi:hypothetical protein
MISSLGQNELPLGKIGRVAGPKLNNAAFSSPALALKPFPDPFVPIIVIHEVADNLAEKIFLAKGLLAKSNRCQPKSGHAAAH